VIDILRAYSISSEVSKRCLVAYHMEGVSPSHSRIWEKMAHEEFAALAAALGYRIEKIEAPAEQTEAA
jgi:hypothetical protein